MVLCLNNAEHILKHLGSVFGQQMRRCIAKQRSNFSEFVVKVRLILIIVNSMFDAVCFFFIVTYKFSDCLMSTLDFRAATRNFQRLLKIG